MTSIATRRSASELAAYDARQQDRLRQEIREAQEGIRGSVSRAAAALYLGVSTKTLYRLIEDGNGPPYHKAPAKGHAQNQHISFVFADLKAWNETRVNHTSDPQQRQRLRDELERAQLRREMDEARARLDALARRYRDVSDDRTMRFDGLASLVEPQPWAVDGTTILGHALQVDDATLEHTEIIDFSLHEALAEDWWDVDQHGVFTNVYARVVRTAEAEATAWHDRLELEAVTRGG